MIRNRPCDSLLTGNRPNTPMQPLSMFPIPEQQSTQTEGYLEADEFPMMPEICFEPGQAVRLLAKESAFRRS